MITSTEENQQLLDTINKQLGSLGDSLKKFNMDANGKFNAEKQLTNDLKKTYSDRESIEKKIFNTGKDLLSGMHGFKDVLASAGILGGIVGGLIEAGNKTAESYRKVQSVGQSFGGSMINLAKAAADAGMPLNEFAEAIKENSTVVAKIGSSSFGAINKQVRQMTMASGHYGMSLDELTKFTGSYLETQREAGILTTKTDKQQAKAIKELASSVSTISGITGKAQEQIMETAQNALRDSLVSSTMRQNSLKGLNAYNDGLQKAITELAGQTGVAGDFLTKALADTASHFGQTQLTDLGKTLIEAGVGSATSVLDQANKRLQAGEDPHKVAMDMTNSLYDVINNPQVMESLKYQAVAGNQAAKQILDMTKDLKKYSQADWDAQQKQKENIGVITSFFETFKTIWDNFEASFIKGFLKPFGEGSKGTQKLIDTFGKLNGPLEKFGGSLGDMIAKFGEGDNMDKFVDGILKAVTVLGDFISFMAKGISLWGKFVSWIQNLPFLKDHKGIGAAIGIGAPIAAYLGGKAFLGALLKNFIGSKVGTMKVNAAIVNIGGSGLGDLAGMFKGKGAAKVAGAVGKEGTLLAEGLAEGGEVAAATKSLGIMGKMGAMFGRFGGAIAEAVPFVSKIGPVLGGATKILGPIGAVLGVGMGSFELFKTFSDRAKGGAERKRSNLDRFGSAAGGALTGAATGAIIGSVVPVIGTAIGAAIGGVGGALTGAFGNDVASWAGNKFAKKGVTKIADKTNTPLDNNPDNTQTAIPNGTSDLSDNTNDLLKKILDAENKHNDYLLQLQALIYAGNKDNVALMRTQNGLLK